MNTKIINKLKAIYKKYLWNQSLEEYLEQSRVSKIGDEEKITDSLFEMMLKDKDLWNYSKDNVLLQQQQHKTKINWKIQSLKPDFETNNEFCKTPILFDAKASNIPYGEMVSWTKTVFEHTFKRYLENIKPSNKYIIWFNLEYIILYWKDNNQKIQVLAPIDVKKLFNNDVEELKRFEKLLAKTKFEELNNEEKIKILENKVLLNDETNIFNIEIFVKKFKNTQSWLYNFFLERLEEIWIDDIPDEIKDELEEFKEKPKDFYIQLANRLTLIEFFKYIFIRTYEDFQLIHKIWDEIIPVTFWEAVKNIKYEEWNLDDFRDKYLKSIKKTSFKEIWDEFFQGFSSLFRKYEFFIEDYILEWDSDEEEFDKEYNNRLFDIIFFLNEFYFWGLESEWDDIIWRLYETSLERADRKRFGQFYTPRYIIDFILDELKITPAEDLDAPWGYKKIVDLSCWTGGFLMKYLSKINWSMLIEEDETHLKNIFKWTYWIDIKMFSTLLTKLNLALIFIIKNKFLLDRKLKTHKLDTKNIITWDWLEINKSEDKKLEKGSFDYVVWNPPYVWIKWNADIITRIKVDPNLSQYFTKKPDLYYFFIIYWIEKLKVWWKFGYIFPREWITADYANKLREYILQNTKILKLIDLNWISIFEDAWTTSCLLFLEKVDRTVENQTFDYIQFKDFEKQNIIKYIDNHSEELQTKTTDTKKQKILSWFEIFSKKIMIPNNFDKIINTIKQNKKFDLSFLRDITPWKVFLNDFIEVKEIKQNKLTDKKWLFWTDLPDNPNIVKLWDILNIQVWVQTWCDNVTQKHIEKWLAKEYEFQRWIFVLKEWEEIRWKWLNDIKNKKENIWKIELNLYENWGWVELNNDEKSIIKPVYWWKDLNIWNNHKTSDWLIFHHVGNFENMKNKNILNKHFNNYKLPLINRNTKKWLIINSDIIKEYEWKDMSWLYNWDWSTLATLWKWHWNLLQKYWYWLDFEKEKIATSSRSQWFTYLDNISYWLSGINYIFFWNKNSYKEIVNKFSSQKDYLKFINAVLNSSIIKEYIKSNKLNAITWKTLKWLKIPKVNFEDKEQVEKYNKIVELADELIEIYADKDSLLNDLVIKKSWWEIVENWSEEFNEIMNSKDFEIDDNVLFIVKIWDKEYFWFDDFKEKLENWKAENKTIWEIFWLNSWDNSWEIKKINSEIDELAKWFYYENKSVPEGYVGERGLF